MFSYYCLKKDFSWSTIWVPFSRFTFPNTAKIFNETLALQAGQCSTQSFSTEPCCCNTCRMRLVIVSLLQNNETYQTTLQFITLPHSIFNQHKKTTVWLCFIYGFLLFANAVSAAMWMMHLRTMAFIRIICFLSSVI